SAVSSEYRQRLLVARDAHVVAAFATEAAALRGFGRTVRDDARSCRSTPRYHRVCRGAGTGELRLRPVDAGCRGGRDSDTRPNRRATVGCPAPCRGDPGCGRAGRRVAHEGGRLADDADRVAA